MFLPKRFKYLESNQIAGAETINPIVDFLRGIRSTQEFIQLNPNANNSMNIELDLEALRNWLMSAYPQEYDEHTFTVSFSETDGTSYVQCTGGTVYFPGTSATIADLPQTPCVNGAMLYVQLTSASQGTLVYNAGGITHTVQPDSGHVTLPVCLTYSNTSGWKAKYYHFGDFAFLSDPYIYMSGYNSSKIQALIHRSGSGMSWIDFGECDNT